MALSPRGLLSLLLHRQLWPDWETGHWTRFGVFGGILIIVPLVGWWLGNMANGIYWATGIILLIYTIETQAMRVEILRQNEMAIQPLLITIIDNVLAAQHRASSRLFVRNIGRGTAVFVHVRDIEVYQTTGFRLFSRFEVIDYLEPGKAAPANVNLRSEGEEGARDHFCGQSLDANLDPRSANNTYTVVLSYEDILGQTYESVMQMGKAGIRLLKHHKMPQAA